MKTWKIFLIGLIILFVTNVAIFFIEPMFPIIPRNVWDALGLSFGIAYMITYNLENKESKVSLRMQRFVNYVVAWIIVFVVYIGLSYLFDKIKVF